MIAPPLLQVERLVAGYERDVPIVRGADLHVNSGEMVIVLGPNGAGKSTLIKAIAGLVTKFSGKVSLSGRDITSAKAHLLARHGLAFVPQTENVFTLMSVNDHLLLAAAIVDKVKREERIAAMYELFPDLARQQRLPAGRLSGGQRQMLAVARALIVEPKLLILDEPSAGLSPKLVELVFAKLADIRNQGIAILMVEQNARAALAIGERAYVLAEGRNRYEGPAPTLWGDPVIADLYLGGAGQGKARA